MFTFITTLIHSHENCSELNTGFNNCVSKKPLLSSKHSEEYLPLIGPHAVSVMLQLDMNSA